MEREERFFHECPECGALSPWWKGKCNCGYQFIQRNPMMFNEAIAAEIVRLNDALTKAKAENESSFRAGVLSERKKNEAEIAHIFKTMGLKNLYSNTPILTREDYYKWEADAEAARKERERKEKEKLNNITTGMQTAKQTFPDTTRRNTNKATLREVRYMVEHKVLPMQLYSNPDVVIRAITKNQGEFFSNLYKNALKEEVFKETDFFVRLILKNSGESLLLVSCPEPLFPPECSYIAATFDQNRKCTGYYTVELNKDGGYYLCLRLTPSQHMILDVELTNDSIKNYDTLLNYLGYGNSIM